MRVVRFALATLAFIVFATAFLVVGNNIGVNGSFEWNSFGDSFGIFGGTASFFALLGVLVLLGAAYYAVFALANMRRVNAAAGTATILIVLALIIGAIWIRIDLAFFGGIWPVLGYILFAVFATFFIGAVLGAVSFRRRATA